MTEINISQPVISAGMAISEDKRYQLQVSQESENSRWDAFLARTSGGHHVQTSLWAQVKTSLGWRVIRLVATQDEQIVAGAQILIRSVPVIGAVGYISKGPIFASDDPALMALVVTELQRIAKKYRIQHLTVQPPGSGENLLPLLSEKGFRPGSTDVAPRATLLLDLSKDLDTILAEMSRKTRYNVRLSGRKGITVREGTEPDLDVYYEILTATGRRQKFSPYPKRYFKEMWRVLHPHGYVKLFLAEFKGEIVSGQLIVPFGDIVINKLSVWSGRHGKRRPNEALQWATMQWSKAQGYRYYDFEGIKPAAAKALLNEEPLPESLKQSVTSYKLGFGGQAALFSGPYYYLYNPLYRWAFTEIFPRIRNRPRVKRMLKRLRTQ